MIAGEHFTATSFLLGKPVDGILSFDRLVGSAVYMGANQSKACAHGVVFNRLAQNLSFGETLLGSVL